MSAATPRKFKAKGDFEVFEELFVDDFVDHTTRPETGRTPDKADVGKRDAPIPGAFPDFHAEIRRQLADGDRGTRTKLTSAHTLVHFSQLLLPIARLTSNRLM